MMKDIFCAYQRLLHEIIIYGAFTQNEEGIPVSKYKDSENSFCSF